MMKLRSIVSLCTAFVVAITSFSTTLLTYAEDESHSIPENEEIIIIQTTDENDEEAVSLMENGDGEIVVLDDYIFFIPNEGFDGDAEITYTTCETEEEETCESSSLFLMSMESNGVEANDDIFVLYDYEAVALDVLVNDTSLSGEILFLSGITDGPLYGTAHVDQNELIFQPLEGFTGVDQLTYLACDSEENCDDAVVLISVEDREVEENTEDNSTEGVCGDGIYQPELGEQCDDGNTSNLDTCSNECMLKAARKNGRKSTIKLMCGNGILEKNEQCDDRNMKNGDGCSAQCKIEEPAKQEIEKNKKPSTTKPGAKKSTTVLKGSSIHIETILKPYLKGNDLVFIELVGNHMSKKSPTAQMKMYQKSLDQFPGRAYTKFNLNKTLLTIRMKAKISQL